MTTNPNAPFGFKLIGLKDGSPPNFGTRTGLIASANAHQIFRGDVLTPVAAGYLDVFTAAIGGGAPVGGIAWAFQYFSTSQGKTVYTNYWPGNGDATGDVTVFYDSNEDGLFEVQALLGPITQASVGSNANFNVGGGGQTIGAGNQSSFSLDDGTIGAGVSLPFKIYRLPVQGPQSQYAMSGYDVTQAYNRVWVTLNNLDA